MILSLWGKLYRLIKLRTREMVSQFPTQQWLRSYWIEQYRIPELPANYRG